MLGLNLSGDDDTAIHKLQAQAITLDIASNGIVERKMRDNRACDISITKAKTGTHRAIVKEIT